MFTGDHHDRTIAATPRRLAEARRTGAFARSRDFTSAVSAVVAVTALILLGPQLWSAARDLLHASWSAPLTRLTDGPIPETVNEVLLRIASFLAVLLGAPLVAALVAMGMQSGFRLEVRWPQMHLSAVSPIAGLRRIRNGCGWFAIGGLTTKAAVTAYLVFRAVRSAWIEQTIVLSGDAGAVTTDPGGRIATISLQIVAVLAALSLADWVYRRRQFLRSLRLTPSEARQEARESKAARRSRTGPPLRVSGSVGVSIMQERDVRTLPSDPLFS
jgi:flagellar biosynthesis protein FlhB